MEKNTDYISHKYNHLLCYTLRLLHTNSSNTFLQAFNKNYDIVEMFHFHVMNRTTSMSTTRETICVSNQTWEP